MIAIIDYDAGNLKSVEKAFLHLGKEAVITRNQDEILSADKVVLPGVGAFGDAMHKLHSYHLVDTIKKVIMFIILATDQDCVFQEYNKYKLKYKMEVLR